MGATTIAVGVVGFLSFQIISGVTVAQFILFWFALTAVVDIMVARGMQRIGPTRVTIGPGEKQFDADKLKKLATVVSGFSDSDIGKVRIHGEIWSARLVPNDGAHVRTGNSVMVVDRDGLILLVSAIASNT